MGYILNFYHIEKFAKSIYYIKILLFNFHIILYVLYEGWF